MINKIVVSNVASYDEGPHEFGPLKKVNYVYGANGSGKTTLTRIIASEETYPTCRVEKSPGQPLLSLVYNHDFIEKNFAYYGGIQSVFSLGAEDVRLHDDLKRLKDECSSIERQIEGLDVKLKGKEGEKGLLAKRDKIDNDFVNYCWESIEKKYKDRFQEAFKGCARSKQAFANKMLSEIENTSTLRSIDYLDATARIVFSTDQNRLVEIPVPKVDELKVVENDGLWKKKIVGSADVDIAALIESLGNGDWVAQGRKYLDANKGKCPFCHQDAKGLKEKLDKYFDKTYATEVARIGTLMESYQKGVTRLFEELNGCCVGHEEILDSEKLNSCMDNLKRVLDMNLSRMNSKQTNTGVNVELTDWTREWQSVKDLIQLANAAIKQHNYQIDNRARLAIVLKKEIWKYIIEEHKQVIKVFRQNRSDVDVEITHIEEARKQRREEYQQKQVEIQSLNSQLVSVLPTIDAINKILRAFGFTQFSLAEGAGSTYKLIRPNQTLVEQKTLSEGEKSFLSFLYFYHIVKGGVTPGDVGANKIVVVDDPVSSLDGEVLFIVSVLMKKLIDAVRNPASDIKQVIVLTHNIHFHKEVAYNRNRGEIALSDETFWVVRKGIESSKIVPCEGNPIKSSYELLWSRIKSDDNADVADIRNTMRRILEYYFGFLGGETLNDVMDGLPEDEKLAGRSLLMWMHDGSHTVGEDIFCAVDGETVDMYRCVFKRIFKLKGQLNHYNMMMKVVPED